MDEGRKAALRAAQSVAKCLMDEMQERGGPPVSRGAVSFPCPEYDWPTTDEEWRRRFVARAAEIIMGMEEPGTIRAPKWGRMADAATRRAGVTVRVIAVFDMYRDWHRFYCKVSREAA